MTFEKEKILNTIEILSDFKKHTSGWQMIARWLVVELGFHRDNLYVFSLNEKYANSSVDELKSE